MSEQDWTPTPWDQTLEAVVTSDGRIIADTSPSDMTASADDANLRRIVAAVNATKDFTTEGLEEIAAKNLTLQLALRATWMMETEKLASFEGMKEFLGRVEKELNEQDDRDTAEYPLSRGD